MSLYTKCILAPIEPSDGYRISVMNRHTLNDGETRDDRITPDHYRKHIPELAPPARLLGDWYKRGLRWDEFERRYQAHLQNPDVHFFVRALARLALRRDLTLLCIEEKPERCHRRLLAEACKRFQPALEITIR